MKANKYLKKRLTFIFLDDERDPHGPMIDTYRQWYSEFCWVIFRDPNDLISFIDDKIEKNALGDCVFSFDNDIQNEIEGSQVLAHMVRRVIEEDKNPPAFVLCHSQNPQASMKMKNSVCDLARFAKYDSSPALVAILDAVATSNPDLYREMTPRPG